MIECVSQTIDDHDVRYLVVDVLEALVGLRNVIERVAAAVVAVARDQILAVGRVHPRRERVRGEAREDDAVWRADPGASEHRDRQLGNHRHVEGDDVIFLDAEVSKRRRERLDLVQQVAVGVGARLAQFALPLDRRPILRALLDVAVETVVRSVELPTRKPLVERRIAVLEDGVVLAVPGEQIRRPFPALGPVLFEFLVYPGSETFACSTNDSGGSIALVLRVSPRGWHPPVSCSVHSMHNRDSKTDLCCTKSIALPGQAGHRSPTILAAESPAIARDVFYREIPRVQSVTNGHRTLTVSSATGRHDWSVSVAAGSSKNVRSSSCWPFRRWLCNVGDVIPIASATSSAVLSRGQS